MAIQPRRAERPESESGLELLDAGDGRRLERFGDRIVDRPTPMAAGPRAGDFMTWRRSDLRFDPGRGWVGDGSDEPWPIMVDGLTLELRPTASGGLGIYPEHAANLAWVADRIRERGGRARSVGEDADASAAADSASSAGAGMDRPQVLNLFAHTGLLTLAAARAGASVAHVDASKSAVDWARRNADLSRLGGLPIRWLVDDALGFVAREARRGRRYDGVILDPPSFGRAGRRQWKLADELPALLAACRHVASDDAFMLLTAHTTGLDGSELQAELRDAFGSGGSTHADRLALDAASGARLELGWSIRRTP